MEKFRGLEVYKNTLVISHFGMANVLLYGILCNVVNNRHRLRRNGLHLGIIRDGIRYYKAR